MFIISQNRIAFKEGSQYSSRLTTMVILLPWISSNTEIDLDYYFKYISIKEGAEMEIMYLRVLNIRIRIIN